MRTSIRYITLAALTTMALVVIANLGLAGGAWAAAPTGTAYPTRLATPRPNPANLPTRPPGTPTTLAAVPTVAVWPTNATFLATKVATDPAAITNAIKSALDPWYAVATYYSWDFAGLTTATGEIFDPTAISSACHRDILNEWLMVTNPENGCSVVLRCNDTGPFRWVYDDWESMPWWRIDLSMAAFASIASLDHGLMLVKVAQLGEGYNGGAATWCQGDTPPPGIDQWLTRPDDSLPAATAAPPPTLPAQPTAAVSPSVTTATAVPVPATPRATPPAPPNPTTVAPAPATAEPTVTATAAPPSPTKPPTATPVPATATPKPASPPGVPTPYVPL